MSEEKVDHEEARRGAEAWAHGGPPSGCFDPYSDVRQFAAAYLDLRSKAEAYLRANPPGGGDGCECVTCADAAALRACLNPPKDGAR